MPEDQRKDLIGVEKPSHCVDCANLIAIAIIGKADVCPASQDFLHQGSQVNRDWLRLISAKIGIALSPDLFHVVPYVFQGFFQESPVGAIYGIADDLETRARNSIHIHEPGHSRGVLFNRRKLSYFHLSK